MIKLTITEDNNCLCEIDEGNGVISKKYINLDEFINNINSLNVSIKSGLLPKQCLFFQKFQSTSSYIFITNSVKNVPITLRYSECDYNYKVYVPDLIWKIIINNENNLVQEMHVNAFYPQDINTKNVLKTPMYRLGFNNIFGESYALGKVCMGNNKLLIKPEHYYFMPDKCFNFFFTSVPFNTDLPPEDELINFLDKEMREGRIDEAPLDSTLKILKAAYKYYQDVGPIPLEVFKRVGTFENYISAKNGDEEDE